MPDFILSTNLDRRVEVTDNVYHVMKQLPTDKPYQVSIELADTSRRAQQNELLWCFNREWAEFNGETIKWAHGSMKRDLLLPLKRASSSKKMRDRGEAETKLFITLGENFYSYEQQIDIAYDFVRSRDITVRLFAKWLREYQRLASMEGCILESTKDKDYLDHAMMRVAS